VACDTAQGAAAAATVTCSKGDTAVVSKASSTRSRQLRFCSTVWTVVECACSSMLLSAGRGRNTLQVLARTPRSGCSRALHACMQNSAPPQVRWSTCQPRALLAGPPPTRPSMFSAGRQAPHSGQVHDAAVPSHACGGPHHGQGVQDDAQEVPLAACTTTRPTPALGTWPNSPQLNVQAAAGTHQSLPSL
jgi:hypothetical protein